MFIKDKIFSYYGSQEKLNDTYKNVDGKGIFERYNESLGQDFDDNLSGLIENLLDNTIVPSTTADRFVVYLEQTLGISLGIFSSLEKRRKFISLFNRVCDIKGTVTAYKVMLLWLGFDQVNIVEHSKSYGFDSSDTFDDSGRMFDDGNSCGCSEYSIQLEGGSIEQSVTQQVLKIIEFNEPINAKLRSLTFNGSFLLQTTINVYISNGTDGNKQGDLVYNNENDPNLSIRLATKEDEPNYTEGDFIIEGPNANKYVLNHNGDLIFTTGSFFFNNALTLNGGGEHVEYSSAPSYNFGAGDFDVSFWFKPEFGVSNFPICSKYDGSKGFLVSYMSGQFQLEVMDGVGSGVVKTLNSYEDDEWVHVVLSKTGINANDYKLYVNSEIQQTIVTSNNLTTGDIDNGSLLFIGRSMNLYGAFSIDDFIIKQGNMSPLDVSNLYNFGEGQDPFSAGIDNVVLRSNFDELLGINIFDQSVNLNHGILQAQGDATNRKTH